MRLRFTTSVAALIAAVAAPVATAKKTPWPAWWYGEAMCIHSHESTDWHKRTDWRGYPSRDHGGMQIDVGTWSVYAPRGFPSDPASASPFQQLVVAYRIWRADGGSWREWPLTSRACGLR